MNALEIRARLFKRQLAILPVDDASLPVDLADLSGQLSVVELPGAETSKADKQSRGADGETDEVLLMAGMITKSLVLTETKERVFGDNDDQAVAGMGMTVLKPLSDLVAAVCGLSSAALEAAKKNSSVVPASASSTSSPANSEDQLSAS